MSKPVAKRNSLTNATLEDVKIEFRNFGGKPGKFNAEGQRNFVIFLDPPIAAQMAIDGWNIKQLTPRDEDDVPQSYISVKLNYNFKPPRVVLITSKGQTPLGEEQLDIVDWIDIEKCDVTIRPYNYDFNGRQGVTAYLQAIYITIEEDYLYTKYKDVPDSAQSSTLAIEGEYVDAEIVEDDEMLEIEQ